MRDPAKDKMLADAQYLLSLYTDESISDGETMASIREMCLERMSKEDMSRASAFLESGEAFEYLRRIAMEDSIFDEDE